jgi:chorismate synthase
MSNGETIVMRAVMKPIPTLMKPLQSVDIASHLPISASTERSDVCAVPAAAVVGEAMTAIILGQAILEKFSSDCMNDLVAAVEQYKSRLSLA